MEREKIGIVVGPKGRGTNMRAIIQACDDGTLDAEVTVVVSPNSTNSASAYAASKDIPLVVVIPGDDYEQTMSEALKDCTVICLAGYMRLLPKKVLDEHPGRILNIHPALLPKFGGKGMYGLHVHTAVLASHEKESGCTVHKVTGAYDEGDIILQERCEVRIDDGPESLAARVLSLEVVAYPEAIRRVLNGTAS